MKYTQMLLNRASKQIGLACIATLLSMNMASSAVAQDSAVPHDTWSSGAPMWRPIVAPSVAVLGNRIYVVGGFIDWNSGTGPVDKKIYNPASNTWSRGVSMPTPLHDAAAAVVNNVLYVFGGMEGLSTFLSTVWAYDPQTKTWSSKSAMPTARAQAAAVVKNNIIYVIGGYIGSAPPNKHENDKPGPETGAEGEPEGE